MPERDPDTLDALVVAMGVRTVSITFSCKVTRKEYDDFRSFESSQSWTLRRDDDADVTPEVAKLVALRYSPDVIAKVLTDLYVGGVVGLDDTKQRIRDMKDVYRRLYDATLHGGVPNDQRTSDSDLPGVERSRGGTEAGPAARAAVLAGQPDGVPAEAGSGVRDPGAGQS